MSYNRRDFLKVTSSASLGLMIGVVLPYKERLIAAGIIEDSFEPNVWIKILPNNQINIVTAKSEMGQHIRTSIPMIIVEELEADWSNVNVVQADTHPEKYGSQSTGGSGSIRRSYIRLRKAGATGREMLTKAASIKWNVPHNECKAHMSEVIHTKTKRSLKFGDLVSLAATLDPPDDPNLKSEKDFKR